MVFGIFGHPVEHTFSPGMHNAAFKTIGMNACYIPFAVRPEHLREAVRAIIPMGLSGLNITVPHKERVKPLLDALTEDAALIGAVNTIQVSGGRLVGHNTDGRGFLRSLRLETGFRPKGKTALIVGCGGAARAVAFNLALAGAGTVLLHDVDRKKAAKLANDLKGGTPVRSRALSADELQRGAEEAHCLINATPLGLRQGDPLPIPREIIHAEHLVCDLVYNPPRTPLLRSAQMKGAFTLSGIGMLLYQGVIAFEVWTGKKAPVSAMRSALVRQMPGRRK